MSARASVIVATIVFAAAIPPALAIAADCGEVARAFAAELTLSVGTADANGTLRSLQEAARSGLRSCPDLEPQLYVTARTAELGYAAGVPRGDGPTAEARKLADEAAVLQPRSVRIATVLARIDGTIGTARHAYEIDPNYSPARVHLALVLSAMGSHKEALTLLPPGKAIDLSASERIARARVLLASGQARAAAHDAAAARRARKTEVEIIPGQDLERDAREVLGFALLALQRRHDADNQLRIAAALGSSKALAQLSNK